MLAFPGVTQDEPAPVQSATSADGVFERIMLAIIEHRLPPGTKLGEDRLAEVFGVSRGRIRQVLARLAHEQVVTLQPNRGAFVTAPTVDQARDIFEARRLIEPGLVRLLVERLDDSKLRRLREMTEREERARLSGDRRATIRLSGEFHVLIAELAGNAALLKTVRELASLTCLIIYLFDAPSVPACRSGEHAELVEAIVAKDAERAAVLMIRHLNEVERCLDVKRPERELESLEAIFR